MKKLKKLARPLRVIVAILSMVISIGLFGLLSHILSFWAKIQLGPTIMALFAGVTATLVAIVMAQIVIAFVLGRFYCSWFCPLGILQDFLGWITFRKAKKERNHPFTRYIIGILALGVMAGGWAIGFRLLDPFSNFGAICSSVISPLVTRLYNLVAPDSAVPVRVISLSQILTGAIPLVIIIALVWWKKRIYCTSICPVGTILGIFSKFGVFRLRLEGCKKCGQCVKVCPSGCIDIANFSLDNERCVRCMNCVSACKFDAIKFGVKHTPKAPADVDKSRRNFIVGSATVAAIGGVGLGGTLLAKDKGKSLLKPAILPPGAGSMQRFFAKCTACQLCVTNCDGNVLRPAGNGEKTVHLKFDHGMCEFNCNKCSNICPTGALMPLTLPVKQRQRIGLAAFNPELCIAVQEGIDCGACAEHCPTGALRMVNEDGIRVPSLNKELCIGCGSCEFPCPVRPERAIVVHPVDIQIQATDPEEYFRKNAPKVEEPKTSSGDWLI